MGHNRPGPRASDDQARLDAIFAASTELAALTAHVRAFASLTTERRGRDLEQWMTAAAASGEPALQNIRHRPARRPGRRHRRVHPPMEFRQRGRPHQPHQDTQTQMYGRANTDLLRRRVLLAN